MLQSSQRPNTEHMENYKEGVVYVSPPFGNGNRYLSRAYRDDTHQGLEIQLSEKIGFRITYINNKGDISGFSIRKLKGGIVDQEVSFSNFAFVHLHEFLQYIANSDLSTLVNHHSPDLSFDEVTDELRDALKTLCKKKDVTALLEALLDHECITSRDIVNTGYRKNALQKFNRLINVPGYWSTYAGEQGISNNSEEKVIQHFLEQNQWIFGYGLDYQFKSILQREPHLSDAQLDGSGSAIADYLMADKRFTTFVELKKPSTPLFGNQQNRVGSWRLSNELFFAVSQILEYKAAGTIKLHQESRFVAGERITQKPYDSKVILVIGNWKEVEESGATTYEKEMKTKTFELFRRDSRNVEIMTYDELLERARFIVEQGTPFNGGDGVSNR